MIRIHIIRPSISNILFLLILVSHQIDDLDYSAYYIHGTQSQQFILPMSDDTVWVYTELFNDPNISNIDTTNIDTVYVKIEILSNDNPDIMRRARIQIPSKKYPFICYETKDGLFEIISIVGPSIMICPRNPEVNQSWEISIDGWIKVANVYESTFKNVVFTVCEIHIKSMSTYTIEVYKWAFGLGLMEYEIRTKDGPYTEEYTLRKCVLIDVINNEYNERNDTEMIYSDDIIRR